MTGKQFQTPATAGEGEEATHEGRPYCGKASGGNAGWSHRRNHAELLKQAKHVVACPGLNHLAVLVAVDIHPGHGRVLVRRCDGHELALVGAGGGPTGDDLVALRDLVVDREAYVGERVPVDLNELLQAFRPGELSTWHVRVVEGRGRRCQLIYDIELALIPDFLDSAPREGFVLLGHVQHSFPLDPIAGV